MRKETKPVREAPLVPFGASVPEKYHEIRDQLMKKYNPQGAAETKALIELATAVHEHRVETDPDRRRELHEEVLAAVDRLAKLQLARQLREHQKQRGTAAKKGGRR